MAHSPKITTITELKKMRQGVLKNINISLITGCFDVLHIGHVEFFRFAKSLSPIVIVGVDNDKTIRLNKGSDRPIFSLAERLETLSELESIDYLFPIDAVVGYSSDVADNMLLSIIEVLLPTHLIVHKIGEVAKTRKQNLCNVFNVNLAEDTSPKVTSSSDIINKIINL